MPMRRTISDHIYDVLKEDIINLRIAPGQKLSECKLATRFNVSRAPVRNAIIKLQEEDLVVVKPQAGTIVMPISLDKAKDIMEIRLLLEPHAASLAATRISDAELEDLRARFEGLEQLAADDPGRVRAVVELDAQLHNAIWENCGNAEIVRIIGNYLSEMHRIRQDTFRYVDGFLPTTDEIRQMFDALDRRSPEAARTAMAQHISKVKDVIDTIVGERFNGKGCAGRA